MDQTEKDKESMRKTFPLDVIVVAVLMIVFGVVEIVTGFTHKFFGLATSQTDVSTCLGVALGFFYSVGGILS